MLSGMIRIGEYETRVKLNILPDAHHEILLGRDFLSQHVKTLNFATNEITFKKNHRGSNNIETQEEHTTHTTRARMAEAITIDPYQETEVETYPSDDILAEKLIFTASEQTHSLGISARNQIVAGNKSTMRIKVKNEMGKQIRLYPNRSIGKFRKQENAQTGGTHTSKDHERLENEEGKSKQFLHERRNVKTLQKKVNHVTVCRPVMTVRRRPVVKATTHRIVRRPVVCRTAVGRPSVTGRESRFILPGAKYTEGRNKKKGKIFH